MTISCVDHAGSKNTRQLSVKTSVSYPQTTIGARGCVLGAVSDLHILKSSMKRKENKIRQKTTTKLGNRSSLDVIRQYCIQQLGQNKENNSPMHVAIIRCFSRNIIFLPGFKCASFSGGIIIT